MAITITKTATKKVAKTIDPVEAIEPSKMSDEALADLYGSLEDKCAALMSDPVFVKFQLAKEELQSRLNDMEATSVAKITGTHWLLDIGTCSKSPRKILDNAAVASFLGQETFAKIAKVSVADAEKYLTPEQVAKVVSEDAYTKNRKITSSFLG